MEVDLDANNNSTDKKGYSLRPRSAPKSTEAEDVLEVRKPRGRTLKPAKQKGLPLSKYRRKTANARERSRMREINEAFETLRRSIPLINTKCESTSEKNTKISTLRLAMKYITVLSNALKDYDGESDKDSVFSDYSLTPPDYRDSYTPSSSSDHSDFSDSFLVTNFIHESSSQSLSSLSSSSSLNFADVVSTKSSLTSWNTLEKPQLNHSTATFCKEPHRTAVQDQNANEKSLDLLSDAHSCYDTSRFSIIEDSSLVRPPVYTSQLTTLDADLRLTSLIPINVQLQSTPVLEDWDDINMSSEFDELLCA